MSRKTLLPSDRPLALPRRGAVFYVRDWKNRFIGEFFHKIPRQRSMSANCGRSFGRCRRFLSFA